ncbi:MAG TPA: ABC transporter permease [Aliicoccus persicus]|uniref:ABC transporter permease n=1 Tax=Aliicoccus persicus TaxID=930138 RepID=A0A921DYG1_9STAP|nr:ABC transporter permease [Aliicoccus persicus]
MEAEVESGIVVRNSKWSKVRRAINENIQLKIGLILLTIIISVAIFAPFIATHNPYAVSNNMVSSPSLQNYLGTDGLGRDLFSGIVYGARTSLIIGILAALISAIIGTFIGGIAGYFKGKVDTVLNEVINIFLMIPTFFLILLTIALFGSSMFNMIIVIGVTMWTGNARLMRAQALSIRERTFISSLEVTGFNKSRILVKNVIPNGIFPIIANTTMNISAAILTEAGLSFLGLGDPNVVSWGQMVYEGRTYLASGWWISTFSGMAIVITVLAFYLVGDGLNKVLSPKLKLNR